MDTGTIVISVLTVVVFAGIIFVAAGGGQTTGDSIQGIVQESRTDRAHTSQAVDYQRIPPVGGPHTPAWLDCNGTAYDQPVDNEPAVHALEHGAVWITYEPNVSSSTVSQLESYLQNYTFLSPVADQGSPIKLTAWGHQLSVDSAQDSRIDAFLEAFRQGPQTPEPGATCNAPQGAGMQR